MRFSRMLVLSALAGGLLTPGLVTGDPAAVEVEGNLLSDRWHYPFNATPGTRPNAGLFTYVPGGGPAFSFDYRDGSAIVQWELEVPVELAGQEFEVLAARIEYWDFRDAEWDPASGGVIELFATGFVGDDEDDDGAGYREASWTGTEPFVGGSIDPGSSAPRDPYPRDLVTNGRAENNPGATPWAIGDPGSYTGGPVGDAFQVTFDFDVSDPVIQAELVSQLEKGRATWTITSTFPGAQPGDGDSAYPNVITSDGVANPGFGDSQEAPALHLTLAPAVTSVSDWNLLDL